ncbi:MAG TPA: hypothetical protein VF753_16860 [Terriglobales bacterium]
MGLATRMACDEARNELTTDIVHAVLNSRCLNKGTKKKVLKMVLDETLSALEESDQVSLCNVVAARLNRAFPNILPAHFEVSGGTV